MGSSFDGSAHGVLRPSRWWTVLPLAAAVGLAGPEAAGAQDGRDSVPAPARAAAADSGHAAAADSGGLAAEGPAGFAGPRLRLRFDWPVGLSGRIEFAQERISRRGIGVDTLRMSAAYGLRVERHSRGVLARTEEVEPIQVLDTDVEREEFMVDFLGRANSIPMNSVVSRDGTLLEVSGFQELRDELWASMVPLVRELGPYASEFRRILNQVLSDEVLFAESERGWNATVGFWVDSELEFGRTYDEQIEGLFPGHPDRAVTFDVSYTLAGRVDCEDGEPASLGRCVELHFAMRPNPAALDAAIREMLPPLLVDGQPVGGARMRMDAKYEVSLVTNPEGLIPYRVRTVDYVDTAGGPAGTVTESVTTDLVYRYDE